MRRMTSSQRLALLLAAAAILVGGFFVARGSDEDTVTTAPGTPAVTSATAPEPASTPTASTPSATTSTATTPATTSTPTAAGPATPVVVVSGGKPDGGVKKLTFAKGDTAAFTVRSDVADEVHVHGYDLMKDVKAGGSVTFRFKAKIDGIFEVELEDAGVQIASLKVTP
jgi:cytoskeletal protein RodZ